MMDKKGMYACIDSKALELTEMADDIFDHPELGLSEFRASGLLTSWLEKEGFQVEKGAGGLETAFKAVFKKGDAFADLLYVKSAETAQYWKRFAK